MAALEKLLGIMEKDAPPWLAMARSDGRLLKLLVGASQARRVLEIGTSHGYGAIWLGVGLEETGGSLTTVEILADRAALARKHVESAGLTNLVTFKEGDAHQILPTLGGPFDLVYINADKDGLTDYFNKLFPAKLSSSALLLAYGAIKQQEKMKPYLDLIQGRSDFTTVVLSTTQEDGFCVSLRRRG
jgi:caffeoyl-CoA O-methyltransferase